MASSFNVLGPLEVLVDGVDVTPRAAKERSLLAMLVMDPGRVVSADRMIDELWPDLPLDRARRVLWVRVAGLRKCLKRAGGAPLLESVAPGYRLAVGSEDVDVRRFSTLVQQARVHREAGDPTTAAQELRDALALWRGEPLADAQGCLSLEAEAARLAETRLDATEDWIDAELACGRHAAVQAELVRLVAAHPLRERVWRQRAICLYRAGRAAEALRACHEFRSRLDEELALQPSTELTGLEGAIRERDPSLVATRQPPQPHALPVALTRFVGRAAELEAVEELLGAFRLVTLTGVGGGGKTRLALEAAAAVAERYPDGVCLVELAPVANDAAVPGALGAALGILSDGCDGPDEIARRLARCLRSRQILLILDNGEHVLNGVNRLVHTILTTCPGVTVLATSRERLHLPGEAAYSVPPLSLPPSQQPDATGLLASDAVALLCDRARAAWPGFAMASADDMAVVGICRRLDGIPLAIELAAAHVPVLGARKIAERLDDCYALLTADMSTGVPERHRTLRATLDWSHNLLEPAEQTALRRLAVFPGDFDLEAAAALIAIATEAAPGSTIPDGEALLSRLVDTSLVMVLGGPDETRFRLLEPIRQYAAGKLAEAGETEMARSRHRDLYLARPVALWPLMTAQKRHEAYVDRENYSAALEWSWRNGDVTAALRLVVFQSTSWMFTGTHEREWLERVLAEPEPAVHPARVRALSLLALNLRDSGAAEARVDELMREALVLAERVGDAEETAACHLCHAEVELARGRSAAARSFTEAALRAYERLGERAGVGWCHHHLGWVAVAENDHTCARAHFEQALGIAREDAGGEWLLPHALAALAPLVAMHGDSRRAVQLAEEAVVCARPFAMRAVLAMALVRTAQVAVLTNDATSAVETLDELLRLLHDLGTRRWLADALEMVAVILERRGDHVEAVVALGASDALRAAGGDYGGGVRSIEAEVRRSRGRLQVALGAEELAAHDERGRNLSPEGAMTEMALVLSAVVGRP